MIDLMLFFANSEIKQIYKITRKIEEKFVIIVLMQLKFKKPCWSIYFKLEISRIGQLNFTIQMVK